MKKVIIGGTFNMLHKGHKALLRKAFELGEVTIGLTSNIMALRLKKREVADFGDRKKELEDSIVQDFSTKAKIVKIEDKFGPTLEEDFSYIVVSPATYPTAILVNQEREKRNRKPIEIVKIEFVLADNGNPISSTKILGGEIDRQGKILTRANGINNMQKVSKVKVEGALKESISRAVDLVGGFDKFIKTGDTVFLKPNFNTADPFPASTDLDFLRAVIELVYDCEPKIVMLGESSTMSLNTRKIMEKLGVFELEKMEQPPRIYVFEEREWIKKEIPGGKYLKNVSLTHCLDRADKLILLPCLKTHLQAQFTGSLKLSVGFMKPYQRVSLHLRHIQEKIAELNKIINSDLVIMDARKCFINKGPSSGTIREPNLILASEDRVAIDVEGIKVIQGFRGNSLKNIDPWQLPQIKRAVEIGIGSKAE